MSTAKNTRRATLAPAFVLAAGVSLAAAAADDGKVVDVIAA